MGMEDQWKTECPKCNNRDCLNVYEVTLASTGVTIIQDNPLYADGFEVDVSDDVKDCSTENEKVCCGSCGEIFDLNQLHV